MVVEGRADLHPILQDEVCAIVREAVETLPPRAARNIRNWKSGIVLLQLRIGTMERVSTRVQQKVAPATAAFLNARAPRRIRGSWRWAAPEQARKSS